MTCKGWRLISINKWLRLRPVIAATAGVHRGGNAGTAFGPLLAAAVIVPFGQRSVAWFTHQIRTLDERLGNALVGLGLLNRSNAGRAQLIKDALDEGKITEAQAETFLRRYGIIS